MNKKNNLSKQALQILTSEDHGFIAKDTETKKFDKIAVSIWQMEDL